MLYLTKPLAQWRKLMLWAMLPILVLSLSLGVACQQADTSAAQQVAAQAQAAAEQPQGAEVAAHAGGG